MENRKKAVPEDDPVSEAGKESFPASDPPSFSGTTIGTPPGHRRQKDGNSARPRDREPQPGGKGGR